MTAPAASVASPGTTARLAAHIASAADRNLPDEVAEKAWLHVLDTLAAMVSGTQLPAGEKVVPFVKARGGREDAVLIGGGCRVPAAMAALGNGMLAHADETDDSHAASLTHPGCAVVPAALAAAGFGQRTGLHFLKAVAAGYDVGPRVAAALGGERFFDLHHSSHAVGGLFGATAAAAAMLGLNSRQCAHALSYAVQQAAGNSCWRRDPDHVEKAFDFAGMPAHHAVLGVEMVAAGFTGVADAIEGKPGLFAAFPHTLDAALATEALGVRFELMRTAIKKWSVGSPIQAALDSLQELMNTQALQADQVQEIIVALPRQSAPVVDNRDMPTVNLQHQLSLLLVDGTLGFAAGHDLARMHDPRIVAMRARIRIDARHDEAFVTNSRQAIVTVTTRDGRQLVSHTLHVRGTPNNAMTPAEVCAKAMDLLSPVMGARQATALIDAVRALRSAPNLDDVLARLTGDDWTGQPTP